MTIRLLDDALVDQIAAGEVVERPAAVVKELLENSLDAGAGVIRVDLRAGGRTLVRVADDGTGMGPEDACLCIKRHATSKIRSLEDLARVGTLGFRGEAIPSIASVSRFELLTRPHEAEEGTRVRVEGGEVLDVTAAGCAPGTDIHVRSLFYNVPVRRKFLRTVPTELGHCTEAIVRQALVHPGVDFRVTHDGRETIAAPATDDPLRRAVDLLGTDARGLVPVDYKDLGVRVQGLVSPVDVHRPSATGSVYLYVNGRFVTDRVVRRGLAAAYRGLLPKGRHPLVVLQLLLDPLRVDVNVHPSKIEVRFHSPRDVSRVLEDALRGALHNRGGHAPGGPPVEAEPLPLEAPDGPLFGTTTTTTTTTSTPPPVTEPPPLAAHPDDLPGGHTWKPLSRELHLPDLPQPDPVAQERPPVSWPQPTSERSQGTGLRGLRVIGQLGGQWILCEGRSQELVAVDLSVARQRLALDRLLRRPGRGVALESVVSVELPREASKVVEARVEAVAALGLVAEPFGPHTWAVRELPELLEGAEPAAVLLDLVRAAEGSEPEALARHAVSEEVPTMAEMRGMLAALDEVGERAAALGELVRVVELG